MNFLALIVSGAALLGSAYAAISISANNYWYVNGPNYLVVTGTTAAETSATVRFTSCRDCFSINVPVNSTVPVVLPRRFRDDKYLNIYAVSNVQTTASSFASLYNMNCVAQGTPCGGACAPRCGEARYRTCNDSPCGTGARRGGCGYYAQDESEAQNEACHSELKFVEEGSEEFNHNAVEQKQALIELIQDLQEEAKSLLDSQ